MSSALDQEIGEVFGVFARFGWQDDDAVMDHDALYSAGLRISGKLWGRENDAVGLGYAHLSGAYSGDIDKTHALEGYFKVQFSEYSDVSFDIQYLKDQLKEDPDQTGWIYGARLNAYF
jgi:porin